MAEPGRPKAEKTLIKEQAKKQPRNNQGTTKEHTLRKEERKKGRIVPYRQNQKIFKYQTI